MNDRFFTQNCLLEVPGNSNTVATYFPYSVENSRGKLCKYQFSETIRNTDEPGLFPQIPAVVICDACK